jgi:hypothetical protein
MNMNKENKLSVKSVNSVKLTKSTTRPTTTTSSEKKVEPVETVKTNQPAQMSNEDQSEITNYINSLSKHETQTLEIAKSHLGSSFTIRKSIGFLEWKSKQKQ